VSNPTITLTDTSSQASSMFYELPMDVSGFKTQFEFMMSQATADGLTFCITTDGPKSLGGNGGGIGYAGIGNSVCIKYDLWSNVGDDANSTGIFFNGEYPYDPSISLSPVHLNSGDKIKVQMAYSAKVLTVLTTDEATGATSSQTYNVDIVGSIGNKLAYVGFTGATGYYWSLTRMFSWTFQGGL